MREQFSRTELLLGTEKMQKLLESKVAVFGVGGVGSFVVEALARAGVGKFILVDNDCVSVSNINRQIIATLKTVGQPKVSVALERIHDINPEAQVQTYQTFYLPENAEEIDLRDCNYIVDAIDTVSAKIQLALKAKELNIPIIASMGTGNKLDPTRLKITDLAKTTICPLAKVMRKELKKRGIEHMKVLYSDEIPLKVNAVECENELPIGSSRRSIPGSISFVPSSAGLIIAAEVITDIIG